MGSTLLIAVIILLHICLASMHEAFLPGIAPGSPQGKPSEGSSCATDPSFVQFPAPRLRDDISDASNSDGDANHSLGLQSETHELPESLCAEGKLLPEVYLLGGPKCATTEMARDLMRSGIASVAEVSSHGAFWPGYRKEFHFFIRWLRNNSYRWNVTAAREVWLEGMPPCSSGGRAGTHRNITADFTPTQLALMSPGNRMTITGTVQPADVDEVLISLPESLLGFYGRLSSRLRFIMNFREPLSRMHSHWYHAYWYNILSGGMQLSIPFTLRNNFSEDVCFALDEVEQGRISQLLWYSLFGRQLQQFLSYLAPHQFILIPYRYYTQLAKTDVCAALAEHLSYPVTCKDVVLASEAFMHSGRPSLEADMPAELTRRFQLFIAKENDLLIGQLLLGYAQGATLPHFRPEGIASLASVETWLTSGW